MLISNHSTISNCYYKVLLFFDPFNYYSSFWKLAHYLWIIWVFRSFSLSPRDFKWAHRLFYSCYLTLHFLQLSHNRGLHTIFIRFTHVFQFILIFARLVLVLLQEFMYTFRGDLFLNLFIINSASLWKFKHLSSFIIRANHLIYFSLFKNFWFIKLVLLIYPVAWESSNTMFEFLFAVTIVHFVVFCLEFLWYFFTVWFIDIFVQLLIFPSKEYFSIRWIFSKFC